MSENENNKGMETSEEQSNETQPVNGNGASLDSVPPAPADQPIVSASCPV